MERTRVAAFAALVVVLSVGGVAFAAASNLVPAPLGAVAWPVSTLLVSEVQTGGASASDEFAEITNVGASAVDLAGLELVYATSTGSTVTRKASWSTTAPARAGPAPVHRQHVRDLREPRRRDVQRRLRGHRRRDRAAGDRRRAGRCHRLGRCHECLRGGLADRGAGRGLEHRAQARRPRRATPPTRIRTRSIGSASPTPNPQSLAAPPVPAPGQPDAGPTASPRQRRARPRRRPQSPP